MLAIFANLVEKCIEVFMDDLSVSDSSIESCLSNMELVLKRCVETNLVLNWEKCHLMVQKGLVLGHKISSQEIEVDKTKIDVIEKLPPPSVNMNGIRCFLVNDSFHNALKFC